MPNSIHDYTYVETVTGKLRGSGYYVQRNVSLVKPSVQPKTDDHSTPIFRLGKTEVKTHRDTLVVRSIRRGAPEIKTTAPNKRSVWVYAAKWRSWLRRMRRIEIDTQLQKRKGPMRLKG